ncbi:MAG: TlpA disulfide reductase family protein [Eubacteriales bacterium]|nr:TlpA disulfide reductase family protein [Eubacteriales bacterium]
MKLSLSLILASTLALVGCGASNEEQKTVADTGNTTQNEKKDFSPVPMADKVLVDQTGREYRFSDFKGKVVFANFFTAWCNACRSELKDIQALYEKTGKNEGDVIVIGVANPKTDENPRNAGGTKEELMKLIKDFGITYPVLTDPDGSVFDAFAIRAFPTTYTFNQNNEVFGYLSGAIDLEQMENIINQTQKGSTK